MKKYILIPLLFLSVEVFCLDNQQKVDSLLKLLPNVKTDTAKISLLLDITDAYRSFETKNALKYCNQALELSKKIDSKEQTYMCYIYKGLINSRLGKNREAITNFNYVINDADEFSRTRAKAFVNIGNVYADLSSYDSSIIMYKEAIKIHEKIGDEVNKAGALNNIGTVYNDLGEFDKAITYYTKALKINEKQKNIDGQASSIENIGVIYYYQKNYTKALEYFSKARNLMKVSGRMDKEANVLGNMAAMQMMLGDQEASIKSFKEAEKIFDEMNDKSGQAEIAQNLATIYFQTGKQKEGLEEINKAIKIYDEIGSIKGVGISYNTLASYYFENKNYPMAIQNFLKAEHILEPVDVKEILKGIYRQLASSYSSIGNYKEASGYFEKFITLNDSLSNGEKSRQIAEMQEKYDSEAKQKAIEMQQIEIEKQNAEVELQTKQKIWFGIGLILALILFLVAYRGYKQKKTANNTILHQKAIVEEKNSEIKDSITYAKRIQNAILPSNKTLNDNLENNFILYQPKDIVAGDFYWVESIQKEPSLRGTKQSAEENEIASSESLRSHHRNDVVLFAAADCTGHGVPGAMVSVVCHNALNRAVREFGLTSPATILNKVRELVIETFEDGDEEVKDGMDIALCSLNKKTLELQYAGANNSLYLIRNNNIIETKADKQPIGKHITNSPFTNHIIELYKDDRIYLFTDGFADQFGGEKGKKFMYKPLKELLLKIHQLPMDEQKTKLTTAFNQWKNNLDQVDDVCVLGICI